MTTDHKRTPEKNIHSHTHTQQRIVFCSLMFYHFCFVLFCFFPVRNGAGIGFRDRNKNDQSTINFKDFFKFDPLKVFYTGIFIFVTSPSRRIYTLKIEQEFKIDAFLRITTELCIIALHFGSPQSKSWVIPINFMHHLMSSQGIQIECFNICHINLIELLIVFWTLWLQKEFQSFSSSIQIV